jgi:Domain of unknown function (DUF6378)
MTSKEEAQELLDSRLAVYGERVENMTRVAKVFSGILGIEVRPDQVPLLMVGYKTVRASQTPDYEDNVKDIEGYAIMFRECVGDDMIAAVNTDEYLVEKTRREAVEERNRYIRAYNSMCDEADSEAPTKEQVAQLQQEVPSYQPGPYQENAPSQHLEVYRQQLVRTFIRTWKEQNTAFPAEKFAESAAREAVEFFWLTFKRNEQLQASIRALKTL